MEEKERTKDLYEGHERKTNTELFRNRSRIQWRTKTLDMSKEGIDFKWLRKVAMSAAKMERERESESVQVFLFIIER